MCKQYCFTRGSLTKKKSCDREEILTVLAGIYEFHQS